MNISNFVTSVEKVQGLKIACLDEIAYKKMDQKDQLIKNINFYGNCPYSEYLKNIKKLNRIKQNYHKINLFNKAFFG